MYPYATTESDSPPAPHNPAANNENPSMSNTSKVDVFTSVEEDRNEHLMFWTEVVPEAMTATLEPGDLLFFPPGWWHAFRSEEVSFSVSMWF
jgi:D-lyxose ketol-isomerase